MDERPVTLAGTAELLHHDGSPAGRATLYRSGEEMTISVTLTGFASDLGAIHLHETGSCTSEGFTTAGPRLPTEALWLDDLPHGFLGNSGTGTVSFALRAIPSLAEQLIFDFDGTAILVHESSHAVGSRIACGVLTPL